MFTTEITDDTEEANGGLFDAESENEGLPTQRARMTGTRGRAEGMGGSSPYRAQKWDTNRGPAKEGSR